MEHRIAGCIAVGLAALGGMGCGAEGTGGLGEAGQPLVGASGPVDATKRPWAAFLDATFTPAIGDVEGTHVRRCTGALIAPDAVLTAAECVVCADDVLVRFAAGGSGGQAGPTVLHAASVKLHPAAFPSLWEVAQGLDPAFKPNCAEQNAGLLVTHIREFKEPGANVAVVRLSEPVAIEPAAVLLDPPRGFSPVQDLAGVPLTLLGRGPAEAPNNNDFNHMREGTTALDFYTNRQPCPNRDFANLERFVLWSSVPCAQPPCSGVETPPGVQMDESSVGDRGGPLLAEIDGEERIIGVANQWNGPSVWWALPVIGNSHAPTFTLDTARFLRSAAFGQGTALTDSDGDNVADPDDNCPLDANVRTFQGQLTSTMAPIGGREVAALASHYAPADHVVGRIVHPGQPIPTIKPLWPWEYCAGCVFDLGPPWLVAFDRIRTGAPGTPSGSSVFAVTSDGARDVTPMVPEAARALLGSEHRRVLASEPEHRLLQAAVEQRELVVRPDTLAVVGQLGIADGGITAESNLAGVGAQGVVDLPDEVLARADKALAYAAVRDELFALVHAPGHATALVRWTDAARTWERLRLSGDTLAQPLAVVFHVDHTALYVLDRWEDRGIWIRLLRVDLVTGRVTVLAPALLVGPVDGVSLTIGLEGDLLLGVSTRTPPRTALARLRIRDGGAEVTGRFVAEGETLAGEARETEKGIGYLIEAPGGFVPRTARSSDFVPVPTGPRIRPVLP